MPRAAKRPPALKTVETGGEAGSKDRAESYRLDWTPARTIAPIRSADGASPSARREAGTPGARREAAISGVPQGATTSSARREAATPSARREAATIAERARAVGEQHDGSSAGASKPSPPRKGQTGPRPGY